MIVIKDKEHSIPFVREVMVESLTRAGVKPWQAHPFTKQIEDELLAKGDDEIDRNTLSELVYSRLKEINGSAAERFKAWREIKKGERDPAIILIGGGTAVGTSTVGTEVAYRIGIKNTIATDSIREIMRKTVSDKLLPALHASSYEAYKKMSVPLYRGKEREKILSGFRQQCAEVSVGIEAIVERALKEGTPTLIEGLHIVPGFISEDLIKRHNVMMFILHIDDEKEHKNRLYSRAFESKFRRSVDSYMENFKAIREIQKYIKEMSDANKTVRIENLDAEKSVVTIMDRVIESIVKQNKKEES